MKREIPRRRAVARRKRFVFFASGAALGSVLGLVVGLALTLWLGDTTVRGLQRGIRRLGGDDSHPHFDLLAQ